MARIHQKSKLNLEEKPYWINIPWPTLKSSAFTIQHHLGDLVCLLQQQLKDRLGNHLNKKIFHYMKGWFSIKSKKPTVQRVILQSPTQHFACFRQTGSLAVFQTRLYLRFWLLFNSIPFLRSWQENTKLPDIMPTKQVSPSKMMGSQRWISESTTEFHTSWYLGVPFPHCRLLEMIEWIPS
jgi:hypothetical protein